MASGTFRFDRFLLDPADRQLRRDDAPVELNARYLDALTLLVSEQGKLVPKDRFLDEVWRGVPVTDEALTQCIKTLRKQLGDSATVPRFIETVPKHGYRFIAPVEAGSPAVPSTERRPGFDWGPALRLASAGTIGSGVAGLIGGLFYGFAGAYQPLQPGAGAVSILLVLVCLTILVAVIGGAGVSLGIAVAVAVRRTPVAVVAGGAIGGLLIGAVVKLLGIDAFNLLLGQSPGDITGPMEGLLLGAAVGVAALLAHRTGFIHLRRSTTTAALCGGTVGAVVPLLGGHMMGGSLDLLARSFPGSRLRLDQIGALVGENGFGLLSQCVTGALEGALFAACLIGGMVLASKGTGLVRGAPLP
ncbi:MAG: transcriptional regulator [Sphingomicrobium sp.]